MSLESDETSDGNKQDLDWKSQEILRALHENDGTANTSEIRTLTGIDNNDKIRYRLREKLAPRDLVTLDQPASDTGSPKPKVATFTQRGVEVAEQLTDERAGPAAADLESRVDKLEADLSRLTDQRDNETKQSSDDDLNDLQNKVSNLRYQMELIADFLNKQYDGGLSAYRERRESNE